MFWDLESIRQLFDFAWQNRQKSTALVILPLKYVERGPTSRHLTIIFFIFCTPFCCPPSARERLQFSFLDHSGPLSIDSVTWRLLSCLSTKLHLWRQTSNLSFWIHPISTIINSSLDNCSSSAFLSLLHLTHHWVITALKCHNSISSPLFESWKRMNNLHSRCFYQQHVYEVAFELQKPPTNHQ